MANTDRPNGFRAATARPKIEQFEVAATQTITVGDMVVVDSNGQVTIAAAGASVACGVAASISASAAAGSAIQVYTDPEQVYEAQCSGTGTGVTAIYSTATSTACYDLEGTTGIQEINEDSTSGDLIQVIGIGRDPGTGDISADGANQRFYCIINRTKNQLITK